MTMHLASACVALALVMIFVSTDHINFAQGEMAMFSTYISWQLIQWGLDYWIAFFLTVAISFVAEVLHRIEQGVDVGVFTIPERPGLRELGLAIIMLTVLVLRPRGLTNGRELPWPRLRRGSSGAA